MNKINKILVAIGILTVAFCGFAFGLARVSAEDSNELLKKQNEQIYEAQKKAAENAYELQKKATENAFEAQKKEQERLKEIEKDKKELEKEMRNASSSKDKDDDEDGDDGDRHRSSVAEFVRKLHEIASSTPGGIGELVREVAKEQNESKDKTSNKLKEIESRGAFIKFLIGANRESVKELQNSVATIESHIGKLNQIKASTTPEIQNSLNEEIDVLVKEKDRVQTIVNKNQNKSGIFGWLIRIFE